MADLNSPMQQQSAATAAQPSTSSAAAAALPFAMTPPRSPRKPFRKTHRRNESKLSRISHLSIRSLSRGESGINSDEDDVDAAADPDWKRPIYIFDFLMPFCPWLPRLFLPGWLRVSPSRIANKFQQILANTKSYDERKKAEWQNLFSIHRFHGI